MGKKNLNNPEEKQCNVHGISGWAYFRKHKTPILLGFAIGTMLCIVLNLVENIIVKLALIVNGG